MINAYKCNEYHQRFRPQGKLIFSVCFQPRSHNNWGQEHIQSINVGIETISEKINISGFIELFSIFIHHRKLLVRTWRKNRKFGIKRTQQLHKQTIDGLLLAFQKIYNTNCLKLLSPKRATKLTLSEINAYTTYIQQKWRNKFFIYTTLQRYNSALRILKENWRFWYTPKL